MPTFLDHYLVYNSNNECPVIYHKWAGLFLLACAAQRRFMLNLSETAEGYFYIYPNLYITLIGTQGGRKTVAKDIALIHFAEKLFTNLTLVADVTSKEKLVKNLIENGTREAYSPKGSLEKYTPCACFIDELKDFLNINPAGMVDFLTNIFYKAGNYSVSTLAHDNQTVIRPCMNFIACECPDWIVSRLKGSIISGGFSSRMLFIYNTKAYKRVTFPSIQPIQLQARDEIIKRLKAIEPCWGEFKFSPAAKIFYHNWYQELKPPNQNDFVIGFYNRKHIHALKIAMLLQLGEDPTNLTLTPESLAEAIAVVSEIEEDMWKLTAGVGRNELAVPMVRLLEYIKRFNGLLPEKDLRMGVESELMGVDYLQIITHLQQTEQIAIITMEHEKRNRKMIYLTSMWELKENTLKRKS